MDFPVTFDFFGWRLHPHLVLEAAGYFVGFQAYRGLRKRHGDVLQTATRWSVILAAALGGVVGSKVLFWLLDPALTWAHRGDARWLMGGKTMVGDLESRVLAPLPEPRVPSEVGAV